MICRFVKQNIYRCVKQDDSDFRWIKFSFTQTVPLRRGQANDEPPFEGSFVSQKQRHAGVARKVPDRNLRHAVETSSRCRQRPQDEWINTQVHGMGGGYVMGLEMIYYYIEFYLFHTFHPLFHIH